MKETEVRGEKVWQIKDEAEKNSYSKSVFSSNLHKYLKSRFSKVFSIIINYISLKLKGILQLLL